MKRYCRTDGLDRGFISGGARLCERQSSCLFSNLRRAVLSFTGHDTANPPKLSLVRSRNESDPKDRLRPGSEQAPLFPGLRSTTLSHSSSPTPTAASRIANGIHLLNPGAEPLFAYLPSDRPDSPTPGTGEFACGSTTSPSGPSKGLRSQPGVTSTVQPASAGVCRWSSWRTWLRFSLPNQEKSQPRGLPHGPPKPCHRLRSPRLRTMSNRNRSTSGAAGAACPTTRTSMGLIWTMAMMATAEEMGHIPRTRTAPRASGGGAARGWTKSSSVPRKAVGRATRGRSTCMSLQATGCDRNY